jgi:hypothetical protein
LTPQIRPAAPTAVVTVRKRGFLAAARNHQSDDCIGQMREAPLTRYQINTR